MPVQVKQLFPPTQLTGSAVTIYTAPATPATVSVQRARARFTNTDTVGHAVTVYAIQSGGTAAAGNCCANALPVPPNSNLDMDLPVLGPSGFYQAFADTTSDITMSSIDGVIFS